MIREIDGGSSHESQNSSLAHFGLASETIIDSLIVKWPGGNIQHEINVSVNQTIEIAERTDIIIDYAAQGDLTVFPNPFQNNITIKYRLSGSDNYDVSVYDAQGRIVGNLINNGSRERGSFYWEVPDNLSTGIYMFVITGEQVTFSTKAFKIKKQIVLYYFLISSKNTNRSELELGTIINKNCANFGFHLSF